MRLDPSAIEKIQAMDDNTFWQAVRAIAGNYRLTLPAETPSPENIRRLKAALSGIGENDISEAIRILNTMRKDPS